MKRFDAIASIQKNRKEKIERRTRDARRKKMTKEKDAESVATERGASRRRSNEIIRPATRFRSTFRDLKLARRDDAKIARRFPRPFVLARVERRERRVFFARRRRVASSLGNERATRRRSELSAKPGDKREEQERRRDKITDEVAWIHSRGALKKVKSFARRDANS